MRRWYYTSDNRGRLGPVTTEQLRQLALCGEIAPTTMVNCEGTAKWIAAVKLKGLFPTPPAASQVFADLSAGVIQPSGTGTPERNKPVRSWAGATFAVLALILGAAAMPVAVVYNQPFGAGLAGVGAMLGAISMLIAVTRRGAGCGQSLAGTVVCLAALFAGIALIAKSTTLDFLDARLDILKLVQGNPGGPAVKDATHLQKEQSEVNLPEVNLPEVNLPEVKVPEVKVPEVKPDADDTKKPPQTPIVPDGKNTGGEKQSAVENEAGGLKPGIAIDEKKVTIPTKSRFNAKTVNETAKWGIARMLEAEQHGDNAFRVKNELKLFNEQMQGYAGQQVEWRFTVDRIFEDQVRLFATWSTFDGSRYPKDTLFPPGSLIMVPRFRVEFYHEGKDLFDPVIGPPGGPGMMGFKREGRLARLMWQDQSLTIGTEVSNAEAARMKPSDVVTVKGKIKAFRMSNDLLEAGFPTRCAVCTLEPDLTLEWKRELDQQKEKERLAAERLELKKKQGELAKKEGDEQLIREYVQKEKDQRAKEIAYYWGAVDEWQAEVRRTGGKQPTPEWHRNWLDKWPELRNPYSGAAIAELQAEERRIGGIAPPEWRKKWREKWDYPTD